MTRARSKAKIDWIEIPAGSFMFGLSTVQAETLLSKLPEKLRESDRVRYLREDLYREVPEQIVTLKTFYISRFPITWAQYSEFAQSDHCYSDRNVFSTKNRKSVLEGLARRVEMQGDHPVDVPWHYALAFCDWIGTRLPTSAEWEKSARGTDGRLYPWGDDWDPSRGNFVLDWQRWPHKTSPVDAYPSGQSPYGVMDMMGNTYEWTLSTTFGQSGTGSQTELVICRGCSCDFDPKVDDPEYPDWFRNLVTMTLSNAMHFGGAPLVGFRLVLDEWHKKAWTGF